MFCELTEDGIDAIDDAGCDGPGSVDVTVTGSGFTATMTYTVPSGGPPAGGVAIRFASADGTESAAAEVIAPRG